jgi:hypothetical protein
MTTIDLVQDFFEPRDPGYESETQLRTQRHQPHTLHDDLHFSNTVPPSSKTMAAPQTDSAITDRLTDWVKGREPIPKGNGIEQYNDEDMPPTLHADVDQHMGTVRIHSVSLRAPG